MIVAVVVLIVTNVATLAVLGLLLLRGLAHPAPGPAVARTLDASAAPVELSSSATRQVISIEILNPIELAGTRGRWAGVAGTLAPGLTKRIVHDQAMKMVRRVLVEERVVADVRLHTIRPAPRPPRVRPAPRPPAGRPPAGRPPSAPLPPTAPSGEVGRDPQPGP